MNQFAIKTRLAGLNELIGANRVALYEGARLKQQMDAICKAAIMEGYAKETCHSTTAPVRVSFEWHEKTRRRDPDNIFSAKKFILDAMQKTKLIVNDSQKYIVGLSDTLVIDDWEGVKVSIEEEEGKI